MINLAKKLNLAHNLISELSVLDIDKVDRLALKCNLKGFDVLAVQSDIMRLAVILTLAVKVKVCYDELGISEEIYFDTMSDIRIWCEHNGNKGLKNYGWLKNHVTFELFKIGRLQFQFYECKNNSLIYKKLPFTYGAKLINIHIPAGEKLDEEKCIASIERSKEFFKFYFPEYDYELYFCESWLLFEDNRSFMDESSNIVRFMSLFDICYSVKIDVQAIERIFGKRRILKTKYPESTDLQRRAKAYILSGKRLGFGVGVIKK